MDLHPLIIHFPIALFSVYAVLEVIVPKKFEQPYWFYIKAVFVILGSATALLAGLTGELIVEPGRDTQLHAMIELHQKFSFYSSAIFGLIGLGYLFAWHKQSAIRPYFELEDLYLKIVMHRPLLVVGALVGLLGMFITGSLGGIIVYGPDVDPFTRIVYNLFFSK